MHSVERERLTEGHLELFRLYTRACVHALNNSLSAASGYQQLLAAQLGKQILPDRQSLLDGVREIEASLTEAESILRALSTWAKPPVPEPKPFLLTTALMDSVHEFRVDHPDLANRLTVETPDSLPVVLADANMVREVLDTLLDNAARATEKAGGMITVSLSREGESEKANGPRLQTVRIADTGCGMEPARLRCLQLPLLASFQEGADAGRGWKGRGLGLPMAFCLLRQCGGKLSVQSSPDRGTTVTLTLPESLSPETP